MFHNLRNAVIRILMGSMAVCALASVGLAAGEHSLLHVVQRYADTMIEIGRDTYGPRKSMMLLSALDRQTLAPLKTCPPAPAGIDPKSRVAAAGGPLVGVNPQHDQNLLRMMYALSLITGDPRYRQAADTELDWYFRNAYLPEGRLAWSENQFWDPMEDKVKSTQADMGIAFFRPWLLWDRCYLLAPEQSKQFAWVLSKPVGTYNPRLAGIRISALVSAYKNTKDEKFLNAIAKTVARLERTRHPKTGLIRVSAKQPALISNELSLAIDCTDAADNVRGILADRLRAFASHRDRIFVALDHNPKEKGFLERVSSQATQPFDAEGGRSYTSLWESPDGRPTSGQMAMLCVRRYEQVALSKYYKLLIDTADAYLDSPAPNPQADTWPRHYAHAISTQVAAFRWAGEDKYVLGARKMARAAVKIFWQGNALPRASTKTQHYETVTGADSLALALLELYAETHQVPVRMPLNIIDR